MTSAWRRFTQPANTRSRNWSGATDIGADSTAREVRARPTHAGIREALDPVLAQDAQRFMDLASKAALKVAGNVLSKPKRSPRLAVIK